MRKTPLEQFLNTAIGTSGTLASLLLLVDRAIVLLKESQQDVGARPENLRKVRNILAQLQMALNFKAGDVPRNLFFLYDYLYEELQVGDDLSLDGSLRLLGQLRDTLAELKRKDRRG